MNIYMMNGCSVKLFVEALFVGGILSVYSISIIIYILDQTKSMQL
jgi:hypothetical protein